MDKASEYKIYQCLTPTPPKTERVYCRTVGEALMAIMYREKKWHVEYQGDWQAWWQANGKYYH